MCVPNTIDPSIMEYIKILLQIELIILKARFFIFALRN